MSGSAARDWADRVAALRSTAATEQPKQTGYPKHNERRGDHVWLEGDRKSPNRALRLDYWSYEPIGRSMHGEPRNSVYRPADEDAGKAGKRGNTA